MADINIPVTNPSLNASLSDQSKVDDSIKQENVVINASDGATINNNSGNKHEELTRKTSMIIMILLSALCDCGLGFILYNHQQEIRYQSK